MPEFTDTHCHIHTAGSKQDDFTVKKWREAGQTDPGELLSSAVKSGVTRLICVGTDCQDSATAVDFAGNQEAAWAAVGVHPHEAKQTNSDDLRQIRELIETDQNQDRKSRKIVAIGEVGLDYYYEHSPKAEQIKLLEEFLRMAEDYQLPVIFHVRGAFADFWPILANFKVKGVLHSFTDTPATLVTAMSNDLFIGLNGIITFTKDETQLAMAKQVPASKLLLETDSPYLTPKPFRGKICKPEHVVKTAEFLAQLRGDNVEKLASVTTENARKLFNIK